MMSPVGVLSGLKHRAVSVCSALDQFFVFAVLVTPDTSA
jgi:hypothetical protein